MNISEIIPTGKQNAISRANLLALCQNYGIAKTDRQMRRLISRERTNSVIISVQDGTGYFRPTKDDLPELRHYIAQEKDRSLSIMHNLKMANNLLADMEVGRI